MWALKSDLPELRSRNCHLLALGIKNLLFHSEPWLTYLQIKIQAWPFNRILGLNCSTNGLSALQRLLCCVLSLDDPCFYYWQFYRFSWIPWTQERNCVRHVNTECQQLMWSCHFKIHLAPSPKKHPLSLPCIVLTLTAEKQTTSSFPSCKGKLMVFYLWQVLTLHVYRHLRVLSHSTSLCGYEVCVFHLKEHQRGISV